MYAYDSFNCGDLVTVQTQYLSPEDHEKTLDGANGRIIGFSTMIVAEERYAIIRHNRTPGYYRHRGRPVVQLENGQQVTTHALMLQDPEAEDKRKALKVHVPGVFLHDLPDVTYEVQDTVTWNGHAYEVTYIFWPGTSDNPGDEPTYNIRRQTETGEDFHREIPAYELTLQERGNVWKYFNRKASGITFQSLDEEVTFHKRLGLVDVVMSSHDHGHCHPSILAQALFRAEAIDYTASGFGSTALYRLHDRELAQRVREQVISNYPGIYGADAQDDLNDGMREAYKKEGMDADAIVAEFTAKALALPTVLPLRG